MQIVLHRLEAAIGVVHVRGEAVRQSTIVQDLSIGVGRLLPTSAKQFIFLRKDDVMRRAPCFLHRQQSVLGGERIGRLR